MTQHPSTSSEPTRSAWAPLSHPAFRSLWLATVASNIGNWMHEVGAGWLMTTLTNSPLLVALIQTSLTLPFFFFALPAGVLTDLLDRRRYLVVVQLGCLVVGGALAVSAWFDWLNPALLLLFSFLLGVGNAATAPAWQAIVPELVPRKDLPGAIALNGVGINVARAVGPALGGLLIAIAGPWFVFALNFISFIFIAVALVRWQRIETTAAVPTEHFGAAVIAGLRFTRYSPKFLQVVWRVAGFMVGASAVWALLPLVARNELGVTATGYGLLLGALGAGAVVFASQLAPLRRRMAPSRLVSAGATVFIGVTIMLGLVRNPWLLGLGLFLAGASWLAIVSTFNVGVQAVLPAWVRGRALSTYLLVFYGGLALGSTAWGALAGWLGTTATLLVAALFQGVTMLATGRLHLEDGRESNLGPSRHWPVPAAHAEHRDPSDGPIFVQKTFRVAASDQSAFLSAAHELGRVRRRDGALFWGMFRDEYDTELIHEIFMHPDKAEHARSHERFTVEDRAIENALLALHRGDDPPLVRHLQSAPSDAQRLPQV